MSLSERVAATPPTVSGCRTCAFYAALPAEDQTAFDEWLEDARPVEALRQLCVEEGLTATESRFRNHVKNHRGRA